MGGIYYTLGKRAEHPLLLLLVHAAGEVDALLAAPRPLHAHAALALLLREQQRAQPLLLRRGGTGVRLRLGRAARLRLLSLIEHCGGRVSPGEGWRTVPRPIMCTAARTVQRGVLGHACHCGGQLGHGRARERCRGVGVHARMPQAGEEEAVAHAGEERLEAVQGCPVLRARPALGAPAEGFAQGGELLRALPLPGGRIGVLVVDGGGPVRRFEVSGQSARERGPGCQQTHWASTSAR